MVIWDCRKPGKIPGVDQIAAELIKIIYSKHVRYCCKGVSRRAKWVDKSLRSVLSRKTCVSPFPDCEFSWLITV